MFDNNLFGDEGDVLAAAENQPSTVHNDSQSKNNPRRHQISSQKGQKSSPAERRRFERIKGGICVSSTSMVPAVKSVSTHDSFGSGEIGAYNGPSARSEHPSKPSNLHITRLAS